MAVTHGITIDVTPEMIEAGLGELRVCNLGENTEEELRDVAAAVFRRMLLTVLGR